MKTTQDSIQNAARRLVTMPPRVGMSCLLAIEMLKAGGKIAVLEVGQSSKVMIKEEGQSRRLMRAGRKVNGNSAQPKQAHWHRFTKGRFV